MALTEYQSGSATMGTTEYSLANASTTLTAQTTKGIIQAFIDVNLIASGDEFLVKVYEKTRTADTQRVVFQVTLKGVQSEPIFCTPPLMLYNGWDITIQKVAGTDRSMQFSVRSAA